MATFVQTNVGLYWGGYSLASTFNAIGLNLTNSLQDDTVYGDTFQSNAAGLSSVSLEGEGYWDSTNDSILESSISVDAAETVVTVTPVDQAAGSPSLSTALTTSEYSPVANGTVGEMMGYRVTGEGRGSKLVHGEIVVVPATYTSSSESATNASIGAVSASQSIYSTLHVTAASGTLNVIVESAPSNWSSESTRITHTAFTSIGAEQKSAAGAITDAFWRVKYTVSGGGSFDFIVSLAVF